MVIDLITWFRGPGSRFRGFARERKQAIGNPYDQVNERT